jgi:hypothetical protein
LVALCPQCHGDLHGAPRAQECASTYDKKTEKCVIPETELDADLAELDVEELSELADEYANGDTQVFVRNYASFKQYFAQKEAEERSDPEPNGGPCACSRCGGNIMDDFLVDSDLDPPQFEVIRQRYAGWCDIWWDIQSFGTSLCSYCQYVADKERAR